MKNRSQLQLAPGSATGLFLREAIHHQAAVSATHRLYHCWGYTVVRTPMVDFFDAHSHLFNEAEEGRIYRLINRDGEILMLRSDITFFLFKHYQSLLRDARHPLRLAYSDSILRHENSIDISRNEHYQTGIELIYPTDQHNSAKANRERELEVLFLLCENLQILGLAEAALHIGSRKIFDIAFSSFLNDGDEREIRECILQRDWPAVRKICSQPQAPSPAQEHELVELFSLIMDVDDSSRADDIVRLTTPLSEGMAAVAEIQAELASLADLAVVIKQHFPNIRVRLDLSEVGARHYYSDLVFQVYLPGIPYAVASGGRYDRLMGEMGLESSALGYSVMLSAVLAEGEGKDDIPSPSRTLSEDFPELSVEERYQRAKKIRNKGGAVCL